MGYERNTGIIVHSWFKEYLDVAHKKAKEDFGVCVSEIIVAPLNGHRSFFISHNGSKLGWEDADGHEMARNQYLEWIMVKRKAGDFFVKFVEVQYEDDNNDVRVTRKV